MAELTLSSSLLKIDPEVYALLQRAAKTRTVVSYSEIAAVTRLDVANPQERYQIGQILGNISTREHQQGRPLLSVLVVSGPAGIPGKGFFDLARKLNRFSGGRRKEFFHEELRKVYSCWSSSAII